MILDALGMLIASSPPAAPPDQAPSEQVTFADLDDLLRRMAAAEQRMSVTNSHRPLLQQCAWWLVNLAKQHVELTQQIEALKHAIADATKAAEDKPRILTLEDVRV